MYITIGIYAVLLIIFLVISTLIFRHTVKFSYVSPRFKKIALIFGILALIIIIFSLYLVIRLFLPPLSSPTYTFPSAYPSDINF